jgi:hypothetical protein
MSFSDTIAKAVNKTVDSFIEKVAATYSIDIAELRVMWSGGEVAVAKPSRKKEEVQVPADKKEKTDNGELGGLGKPELVAQCKTRGLKTTGTKAELIARLSGEEVEKKSNSAEKPPKAKATSKSAKPPAPAIVKTVQLKIEPITLSKNSFGNNEHKPTGLVFNKETKKVFGKQNPDGSVTPLTDDDIETCNKYKFQFMIPENLNTKKTSTAMVVEGIPDEDEEELGEELEEEIVDDDADDPDYDPGEDDDLLDEEEEVIDDE